MRGRLRAEVCATIENWQDSTSRRCAGVPEQQDVQFEAQQRTAWPTQEIDGNCK